MKIIGSCSLTHRTIQWVLVSCMEASAFVLTLLWFYYWEQVVVIFESLSFLPSFSPKLLLIIQLGLDDTRLHRINGIMVLLSFFTCRILVFPFMYWMYGQQFGIPLHRVAFHLPLQCNVGNLVILAPQIYWFILLLRKANRLYRRQKRGKGDGNSPKTKWRIQLIMK